MQTDEYFARSSLAVYVEARLSHVGGSSEGKVLPDFSIHHAYRGTHTPNDVHTCNDRISRKVNLQIFHCLNYFSITCTSSSKHKKYLCIRKGGAAAAGEPLFLQHV